MTAAHRSGPVQVKICGLRRREDVLAADRLGADYLGVILSQGFGRSVEENQARVLLEGVSTTRVAVVVDETPGDAARRASGVGAGVVQLHGSESPEDVVELCGLGDWQVWKAVRVRGAEDLRQAVDRYAHVAQGLLVEGWKEGVVGGGGAKADFDLLADLRDAIPGSLTLVLAGGLDPGNVAHGVARCRPSVVDVSSGVEDIFGEKSEDLIRRFIAEARAAS